MHEYEDPGRPTKAALGPPQVSLVYSTDPRVRHAAPAPVVHESITGARGRRKSEVQFSRADEASKRKKKPGFASQEAVKPRKRSSEPKSGAGQTKRKPNGQAREPGKVATSSKGRPRPPGGTSARAMPAPCAAVGPTPSSRGYSVTKAETEGAAGPATCPRYDVDVRTWRKPRLTA